MVARACVDAQPGCAAAMAIKEGRMCGDGAAGQGLLVSGNPCGKGSGTKRPATVLEAPAFPSVKPGVAGDPGGTFTPATILDPAEENASGGLESASATMLSLPVT